MLLELEEVGRTYDSPAGPLPVLRGVTLSVAAGESLAVLGPSGSGKSTLLNLMGALDVPTSGRVRFEGRDVAGLGDDGRADLRNRLIGFVFQAHHLLPQLTVRENVLVPALVRGVTAETEARALRLLDRVGLGSRIDHTPGALSGGERQRAAVVRALVNEPKLILADEPTGSLDQESGQRILDVLALLKKTSGTTLILVTHDEAVASRAGRVIRMLDGRVVG
jgi:predicted ABC-type transport system involved in lysophospholipase L1 biosynthesis ATPase subunit